MSVIMIFRVALKALNRNKMRTALTMLGMIIVQAGNFTQGGVRQGQGNASTLSPDDAAEIAKLPGVQYAAAGVNTRA